MAGDTEAAARAGASEPAIEATTPRREKDRAIEHRHDERRRRAAEIAGAEIRAERGQPRARRDDAERDADRRPCDTDDGAAEQRRGELLAHRQPHGVQKRNLAPAPRDHQHLRRIDEERAREQRHQRERRQVRAIRARQPQGVVARLTRRYEPRPAWQDRGNRVARRAEIAAGLQPQIDAIEPAEPCKALLRLCDVEHPDLLAKGAGRQEASHPQALRLESDLDAELVARRERQRFGRRRAQPDRVFRKHPGRAHGGRTERCERRLQFTNPERVDPQQLQRAFTPRQARAHVHDGTRDRDHRQFRERRVQRFIQSPRPGALHGQVRDSEQAARRELHLVGRDAIDEVHGQPERDTQRDRHDRDQRPSR